jgi:hypothetical protein
VEPAALRCSFFSTAQPAGPQGGLDVTCLVVSHMAAVFEDGLLPAMALHMPVRLLLFRLPCNGNGRLRMTSVELRCNGNSGSGQVAAYHVLFRLL